MFSPADVPPTQRPPTKVIRLSIVWCAVVSLASIGLLKYDQTAGQQSAALATWPSEYARDAHRATLLLFAHPKCPCTRATMGELEVLMNEYGHSLSATVIFIKPSGSVDEWAKTELWHRAAAIPGVTVREDAGNAIASRFGALTSGDAMLYSPSGELLFRGGITAGRGHAGENEGRSAIASFLDGRAPRTASTKVYGCPLTSSLAAVEPMKDCPR